MIRTAALAALLAAAPCAAQRLAPVPGLAERLGSLRFSRAAAPAPASATESSVPGVPVAAPDVSRYPVRGIDVSVWQDRIDWPRVAQAGVSFAYIKATEGSAVVDDEFHHNWAGAARAGVRRGAYHYWDFCASGAAQAARFIKTVPREAGTLPPAVDVETSRACQRAPSKEAFQKNLAVFLAKVERAYGLRPMVYVNYSAYERFFGDAGQGLKIWIADPHGQAPRMPLGASWTLWQYSWKGRLPGIDAPVDLDVFNGTPEMLAELK